MGYIYKITNQINGKIYIGQTTSTVEQRWKKHKQRALNDPKRTEHFILALRKWGPENFTVETIEECPNELLSEREQYWIDYYNSFFSGYNSTYGGEGGLLYNQDEVLALWKQGHTITQIASILECARGTVSKILHNAKIDLTEIKQRGYNTVKKQELKAVEQYDENGQLLNTYISALEAAHALKCSEESVAQACRNAPYANGYYWQYSENTTPIADRIKEYQQNKNLSKKRAILKLDFDGNVLQRYSSLTDAAADNDCSVENIYRACNNYYHSACGFIWEYEDNMQNITQRIIDIAQHTDPRGLTVKQYSLTGEYLNTYDSLSTAAKAVGGEKGAISKAVNKYSSAGFLWVTPENESLISQLVQNYAHKHDSKKKKVYQYSLDGTLIQTFDCAKDAAKYLGVEEKYKSITRTCQGYQKTFMGFKWGYE